MREFRDHEAFITIDVRINKSLKIRDIEIRFDDDQKKEADYILSVLVTWAYEVSDVMRHFFPWLEYDYLHDPEEYAGEFEEHRLSVHLTDAAEGFLLAEDYFENGLSRDRNGRMGFRRRIAGGPMKRLSRL